MKMSQNRRYTWGWDPAWVNCGVAVLDQDGALVFSKTINPSEIGFSEILDTLPFEEFPPTVTVVERYVPYAGIRDKNMENVLMLIGAIVDRTRHSDQYLFRAIDWKTMLVKERSLHHGFKNPSEKLDKKFSKALATHLTGVKFKTDHEADAACLAFLGMRKLAP